MSHVVSATKSEDIPTSPSKMVIEPKDLPSFNIDDLLSLPQTAKSALNDALLDSNAYSESTSIVRACASYCTSISFSNEDLLLGSKPHNRPLFALGYMQEHRVQLNSH